MPLTKKSQIVVLLSAIAIVVILLMTSWGSNIFLQSLSDDSPPYHTNIPLTDLNNLNTVHNKQDVWTGNNAAGTGWPFKEMIEDTKFVTSYTGSSGDKALSERIAIEGNIYESSIWIVDVPRQAYYNVWLKENGMDWRKIVGFNSVDTNAVKLTGDVGWKTITHNPISTGGELIWVPAISIQLVGSHVGALKVELVFQFQSGGLFANFEKIMSVDYCYLVSGNGKINIAGHQATDVVMYEVGETVPIQVSADYSGPVLGSTTGRWQLWAYPLDGRPGVMIKEWTYDFIRETYNWKLPVDAWKSGTTDSKWAIELKNTLFSADAIMINTIDVKANAPPTPTMTFTPNPPKLGEEITVSLNGKINSITNQTLTTFWVRCTYIDTNQQFLYTSSIPAVSNAATFKFTPPRAGKFKLQAGSHDKVGRESEKPAEATVDVYQGNQPIQGIPGGDLALWLVIAIIAIAILGIGLFIYQSRGVGKGGKWKMPKFKWRKKR